MHFKTDREHFNVMAFGLEFGLGTLTAEELADFFDSVCPCGAQEHDPENMRKLRGRILEALSRLDAKTTMLRDKKA